jgi:hypothetical protein
LFPGHERGSSRGGRAYATQRRMRQGAKEVMDDKVVAKYRKEVLFF